MHYNLGKIKEGSGSDRDVYFKKMGAAIKWQAMPRKLWLWFCLYIQKGCHGFQKCIWPEMKSCPYDIKASTAQVSIDQPQFLNQIRPDLTDLSSCGSVCGGCQSSVVTSTAALEILHHLLQLKSGYGKRINYHWSSYSPVASIILKVQPEDLDASRLYGHVPFPICNLIFQD